ncbi:hypothetical protein PV325_007816, partial [Microctonus aethiopoides]
MLRDYSPIVQTLLGTLFTWSLTAAGAALVVIIQSKQRKLLDVSLGFAAGVMVAASYWSLLAPAIEMAEQSKIYGDEGNFAFIPIALGFLVGAAFVYGTDFLISSLGFQSPNVLLAMQSVGTKQRRKIHEKLKSDEDLDNKNVIGGVLIPSGKLNCYDSTTIDGIAIFVLLKKSNFSVGMGFYEHDTRRRQPGILSRSLEVNDLGTVYEDPRNETKNNQWRRILLLVVAITVHNIPEGLAVGVGFGAVGSSTSATFENA